MIFANKFSNLDEMDKALNNLLKYRHSPTLVITI